MLEGILSKRRDARYRSGRSLTWLKIKTRIKSGGSRIPTGPFTKRVELLRHLASLLTLRVASLRE